MSNILSDANKKLHNFCTKDQRELPPFIIRKRGGLLHVCISSCGCKFGAQGSCVMCNYGSSKMVTKNEISQLFSVIREHEKQTTSILIGTYGSFFDNHEISSDLFEFILDNLSKISIDIVIFETHYLTLTDDKLQSIQKKLHNKDIVIEVGLESSNYLVQQKCLNKYVDLDKLVLKIDLIHSYGMSVTTNIFLGAPFLTCKEQIDDSLRTVQWAFDNKADNVVIFPANIRKNTLIEYLYKNGHYEKVSGWSLFELIRNVPLAYQNKIFLSWYGDWEDENIVDKSRDHNDYLLINLFNNYLNSNDKENRVKLLEDFLKNENILTIYKDFVKKIHVLPQYDMEARIEKAHEWILKNIK